MFFPPIFFNSLTKTTQLGFTVGFTINPKQFGNSSTGAHFSICEEADT